ncbi:MAG: hypothetical protein GXZ15_04555 [Campylobacter sp.]|nr:hypothetical protein [Campylobacter sp.]
MVKSEISGVYKAGLLAVDTLIDVVPQMRDLADIKDDQFSNIASTNIWIKLSQ